MTTPAVLSGNVVQPSATASRSQAAAARLGEVLKEIINRSGAFLTEDGLRLAEQAVTDWVAAMVPGAAMNALDTQDYRAAREDVAQRIPPGGPPVVITSQPAIDYDKLAAAIIAAQSARIQAQQ